MENKKHIFYYVGNCKNTIPHTFSDANEMQQVVQYDECSYNEMTLFHNPEKQISIADFEECTGYKIDSTLKTFKIKEDYFIGRNRGFIFIYDYEKDIHHFWS